MRILYFNPETDYALASGASFYTPPAIVERYRQENQLLPTAYAREGDVILVDDTKSQKSEWQLTDWKGLGERGEEISEIRPWGWNHALLRRLKDAGVSASCLPSEMDIDILRQYSHRRSTIALNQAWNRMVPTHLRVDIPEEITDTEECIGYWKEHSGCWMKAPWSSSGRGVINTAADLEERHIRPWCSGIIRRQGSVMVETGANGIADFASEWKMSTGRAIYMGISSFETSRRGKYIRNHSQPQEELTARFDSISSVAFKEVIEIQCKAIEETFKEYDGPIGIDMIVCEDGKIRPFVEANLRITMGMIHLKSAQDLL